MTFNELKVGDCFRMIYDADHVINIKIFTVERGCYVNIIGEHHGIVKECIDFVPVQKIKLL